MVKVKLRGVSILTAALVVAAVNANMRGAGSTDPNGPPLPRWTGKPSFAPARPAYPIAGPRTPQPAAQVHTPAPERAFVDKYCVTCHSDRAKTGGFKSSTGHPRRAAMRPRPGKKSSRKLRAGMMPPLGMPRPDQPAIDGFVTFLETSIDRAALSQAQSGPFAAAPSQPRRVRQRHPRSARARHRRQRVASARRSRRTDSTTSPTCSRCRHR